MVANASLRRRAMWLGTTIATTLAMTLVQPLTAQTSNTATPASAAPADDSSSKLVAIDDLRAPTSPAFSLLGVTPASVDRPQSTKALTLNLLSALNSGDGIPKNYALELTPYWFASHPGLTFDKYYSQDPARSMLRTLSISLATAPLLPGNATAGSQIALGVRATIIPGQANALLQSLRDQLVALDKQLAGQMGQGLAALKHEHDRYVKRLQSTLGNATRASLEARIHEVDAKIADLAQRAPAGVSPEKMREAEDLTMRIQELDAQRVGFMLTVAGGQVWGFAGDAFSAHEVSRTGVWATPAYRLRTCELAPKNDSLDCASSLDFIGVLRYLSDHTATSDPSRWDVGGRLVWQVSKPLALSAEAVRRNRPLLSTSTDPTHRVVAIAEYRVRDDMLFFASFGKDFEKGTDHKTLVTLLGLNFGFGQKPVIDLSAPSAATKRRNEAS